MKRYLHGAAQVVAYTVFVFAMSFLVVGFAIIAAIGWALDKARIENPIAEILERDFHF